MEQSEIRAKYYANRAEISAKHQENMELQAICTHPQMVRGLSTFFDGSCIMECADCGYSEWPHKPVSNAVSE